MGEAARSWGLEANQSQNQNAGDGDHGDGSKDGDGKTSNQAWTKSLLAACEDGGSGEALSSAAEAKTAGESEEDTFRRLLKECGREAQASISFRIWQAIEITSDISSIAG